MKKESCKGFFGKIESYKLHFVWGWQFVRKKSKIGGVRCLQTISVGGTLARTEARMCGIFENVRVVDKCTLDNFMGLLLQDSICSESSDASVPSMITAS